MRALDPFFVAASLAAKYGFSEAEEQVLRGMLAGWPDEVICRFENRRRSLNTLRQYRATFSVRMSTIDKLRCVLIKRIESRKRQRELVGKLNSEIARKINYAQDPKKSLRGSGAVVRGCPEPGNQHADG